MPLPPTAIIAKAVPELGGPEIEAGDIEWTSHIPAGQKIVQWLVDQCGAPEYSPEDGNSASREPLGVDLGAALRSVALENEELKILKCAESTRVTDDHEPDTIHAPLLYAPPSHLRKHATHLDVETRLLEVESATLQSRLRQMKQASHRAAHTISSLEAAIKREDAAIAHIHECLADLSVLFDTTLSSGTNTALALLDTLAPPPPQESNHPEERMDLALHPSLASPTESLTRLANFRAAATEQHVSRVALLTRRAPKALLEDSAVLSLGFEAQLHNCVGDDPGRLREAAYALELRRMYEALGQAGAIPDLDLEEDGDGDVDVDVIASLEKAWALDQVALLDAEREVLDFTIQMHNDGLLPGLHALHTRLSARERAVRAAEAWVGAFGIEVEGVSDAGREAHTMGNGNADQATVSKEHRQEFEQELKALLLQHHNKHHGVDEAPPVLLDRADIFAELRRIQNAAIEGDRDGWKDVAQIKETLGSLNATHQPLLSVLYGIQQVQTNASPPFGRSVGIEKLEQRTQEAVTRLERGVGQGEKLEDILDGKRTQRKLGEFVDRWVGRSV